MYTITIVAFKHPINSTADVLPFSLLNCWWSIGDWVFECLTNSIAYKIRNQDLKTSINYETYGALDFDASLSHFILYLYFDIIKYNNTALHFFDPYPSDCRVFK